MEVASTIDGDKLAVVIDKMQGLLESLQASLVEDSANEQSSNAAFLGLVNDLQATLRCSLPPMPPPSLTSNKLNLNSPLKRDSSKSNKPKKLLPEPVSLLRKNSAPFGKPTTSPPEPPEPPKDRSLRRFNKFLLRDSRA